MDLLDYWDLDAPHIVTHDYGGVVSLRGLLLHGAVFSSLALVDVVALAPWGTDFFRLVRNHVDVLRALPPHIHEGALRSYVAGASHRGIGPDDLEALIAPWRGAEGQAAFYRQIAQADQVFTDEVEHRYPEVELPVLIVWGQEDAWLPVDMAYRLHDSIPGSELRIIREAGHLIQIDQPTALAAALTAWLTSQ